MDLQNQNKQSRSRSRSLHIAVFPWLAYGHLMPFFEVAKFLALKGHHVYFISTRKNINCLPKLLCSSDSDPQLRISFIQLPLPLVDGLPQGAESTSELPAHQVPYLKQAHDLLQLPLTNFLRDSHVSRIVHDFASHWLPRAASQLGVNSAYFSIFSAATQCFLGPPSDLISGSPRDFTVVPEWIYFNSDLAFKQYELIINVEAMDSVSDFFRFGSVLQHCGVLMLRSCPEFEPDAFRLLSKILGKPILPVGFLPPSLEDSQAGESWPVLKDWLDSKQNNSVVYVAFGTESNLSQELMHELAYGL